ncbi:MAG: calcium-binding protein [Acidovorax sp.]|nr:MAG: calcium-binding protein [Acidovorax sp.]
MAYLPGSSGNDTLIGADNVSDDLEGFGGNDSLVGGGGRDFFDRVVYTAATGAVNVNLSTGRATGADGNDTLVGIEMVLGSAFNDTITGSTADSFEMFEGGLGNDTIDGGAITNNGNPNRVSYQGATGSVTVDLQTGTATGADGTDKLININQIRGSSFNDVLLGSNNPSAYVEFFDGRGGSDVIDGRGGTDWVRYDGNTGVHVDLAAGRTYNDGTGGTDTLAGIEGIQGSSGNDTLIGGNPQGGVVLNDGLTEFFRGGAGNDTIDGKQGFDRVFYDTATTGVVVNLSTNSAQDGLGGTDVLYNIEAVSGSSHDDALTGGTGELESFEGGAGNDTITGNGGWDRLDYRFLATSGVNVSMVDGTASDGQGGTDTFSGIEGVRGGGFNDTIVGDAASNKLEGLAGNDSIDGGDGNDSLEGGAGNDTILGGGGNDNIWGGAGDDSLQGGSGWDFANYSDATAAVNVNLTTGRTTGTGSGTDTLAGFEGVSGSIFNDTITGDANNNDLSGGLGNDSINGGGGLDRVAYWGANGSVTVNLATGRATGADGNDTLVGISGVSGSAHSDTLIGNSADNGFEGGAGNDSIDGGAGNDWVWYGAAGTGVSVNLAAGSAADGLGGTDMLTSIENVAGSSFADTLLGSDAANTLTGDAGDDLIDGGAGNDWLGGNAGNDTILGGAGGDILQGGAGNDSIDGGAITDRAGYTDGNTLSYEDNTSGIVMNLSGITGDGGAGSGTVTDGWGNTDTVVNVPFIRGSAHADSILGSSADILESFEGGAGNDTIDGGSINNASSNRINFQNAGASVTVDLLAGTASGAATGNDQLANFNQVRGSGFNDTLLGSDVTTYSELFEGRGGNDVIDGRGGFDIVRYDFAPVTTGVNVNLAAGTASDGQGGTDTLSNIEGVRGTALNDTLVGSAADNRLEGKGGTDSVSGAEGNDTLVLAGNRSDYTLTRATGSSALTLARTGESVTFQNIENVVFADQTVTDAGLLARLETEQNDTLVGDGADDLLNGKGGNDLISGLGGNDTLLGGAGDDTLDGGTDNDRLEGGAGNDVYVVDSLGDMVVEAANAGTDLVNVALASGAYDLSPNVENATVSSSTGLGLMGNALNNVLIGNDGDDTISGGLGADTLQGGSGNDRLDGGAGVDRMVGGMGDDEYFVDSATDVIIEDAGAGADHVSVGFTAAGTYVLAANVEDAKVESSASLAVNLTGNGAGNALVGHAGKNILIGGLGNDTLEGNGGADTVDGGADTDTLVLQGNRNEYTVSRTTTDLVLTRGSEIVTFRNVENIEFADTMVGEQVLRDVAAGDTADNITGTSGADNFDGKGGNDTLNGVGGNDTLAGGLGDDKLFGGDDNDALAGGAGNDTLDGGLGDDALDGGAGNDTYFVDSLSDQVMEALNAGTDTVNVVLASGSYALAANVENALVSMSAALGLVGNGLNNVLTGNLGNDTLSGGLGNDTLVGNAGNDTLDGGAGSDGMAGGADDDTYLVDVAADVVTEGVGAGTDLVQVAFAAAGSYTLGANVENGIIVSAPGLKVNLTGNAGNNLLTGNTGDNVITGGAGDDTLVGAGGNDTLDGGVGTADVAAFSGVFEDYVVARLSTTDVRFTHLNTGAITIVRGAETFTFDGGGPNRTLSEVVTNTASAGADTINGTSGADSIDGLAGNDVLNGLGGNDTLIGGLGDDKLDGGADGDRLEGGAGNDIYTVDSLADQVIEALNAGTDLVNLTLAAGSYDLSPNVENATVTTSAALGLMGNALNNVLTGNDGNDTLNGGLGSDTLVGGAGNDLLDGGAGGDRMTGGTGDDTYLVDAATDMVVEGTDPGTDLVQVAFAAAGTYTVAANVEHAAVINGLNVNLTGNAGGNALTGGAGNNLLNGMAGNDTLAGGLGSDTLTGGLGADTFVFDTAINLSNADRITDFSSAQGDKIQLSASVFSALGVAGNSVNLDGVVLAYSATTGALTYDADGAGGAAAVTIVTLGTTTHPALTNGDFLALV